MALGLVDLLDRLPPEWGTLVHDGVGMGSIEITGIAEDSRRVTQGTLFIAHGGRGFDGHRYIPAALAAGAKAVVGELSLSELPRPLPDGIPYWQVENGRQAFALLSAAFFGYPSRTMVIVGVTGTDGKTTTSTLVHSILSAHSLQTGLITTIAARIGTEELDTGFHVTTPEAFDLQRYLAQMVSAGCQAAVIETTSHALDQARVAEIDYDVAAVTNVTHEHLDWHGDWDNYMAAKARLFQMLSTSHHKQGVSKCAVLNLDDQSYAKLAPLWAERRLTYTLDEETQATCQARDIVINRRGTQFTLITPEGEAQVRLKLFGRYNVANALCAAGVGLALFVPLGAIVEGLEAVTRIRGRMEWVYSSAFDVVIDFAHTPRALEEAIRLARELRRPGGRVILVFGSAGLRDVEKRELMGGVACAADFSIITAEDPRTEDVNAITEQIVGGFVAGGRTEGADFIRVPDRTEAISTAIEMAREGDIILACGKAHEKSMCYGVTETPWDEFAVVKRALRRRGLRPSAAGRPSRSVRGATRSGRKPLAEPASNTQ